MYINKLSISNYLSFKKLNLNLNENTLYIVTGINLDDGGKNGVGKSALIESIIYAIYGKNIRIGSNDINDIINYNSNNVSTEIEFGNYIIKRERNRKKKNDCKIYKKQENNIIEITKRTVTESNNYISENILNFNNFIYVNYFNPSSLLFFALTPKQKFEFIETLLQLSEIDSLLEHYKNIKLNFQQNITNISQIQAKYSTTIEIYKKEQQTLLSNINTIQKEIENKNKQKQELKNEIINNLYIKILNYIKKYKELNNSIKIEENKLNEIKTKLESLKTKVHLNINKKEIYEKITEISNILSILENIYSSIITYKEKGICPTCKRPYIIKESEFISNELNKYKNNLPQNILKLTTIKKLENKIKKLKEEKQKYNNELKIIENISSYENNIINIKNNIEKLNNRIEILKNTNDNLFDKILNKIDILNDNNQDNIKSYILKDENIQKYINEKNNTAIIEGEIKQLEKKLEEYKTKYNDLHNQIITNTEKLEKTKKEIENINLKIEKIDIIIKELSYNGNFRNKLIENYITELEKSLNIMIKSLYNNFKLKLEIVDSGRNKGIDVKIFDNDIEKNYGQLSTGEKRLVDISLLLTFSNINNDFILIDEALDSLSYENQEKVINLLLQLDKQIFLVTHNEKLINKIKEKDKIKIINLEKQNGISILKDIE